MDIHYDGSAFCDYKITRQRFIPAECFTLKDDVILCLNDDILLTHWKTLGSHADFAGGISAIYLKEGWKVSLFYDNAGKEVMWYCDIMEVHVHKDKHIETIDLLLDIVNKNGSFKIVDADELADALEKGLITKEQCCNSLRQADKLLRTIYEGRFSELQAPVIEAFNHIYKNK